MSKAFDPVFVNAELQTTTHLYQDAQGMEIFFSVTQEADGGFVAECLSHDIFTEGDTWEQLRKNVQEAVSAYFFDQPKPARVRLHLVRDEVLVSQ